VETTADQPESIEDARSKAIERLTRIFDRRIEPTLEPQATLAEEKAAWLEEKKRLEKTIADLNSRLEQWRQRQTASEKKLEESLLLRDQFIERMQNTIEEQTQKHQAQLAHKDAQIAELEMHIRRLAEMKAV
jgi:hypothetical protein